MYDHVQHDLMVKMGEIFKWSPEKLASIHSDPFKVLIFLILKQLNVQI